MTKKQLLATLATSTLLLSSTGVVLADEVTPVDPTAPSTEVVTPSTGTEASTDVITPSTETPATTPSDSGSTTTPTTEVTKDNGVTTDHTGDNDAKTESPLKPSEDPAVPNVDDAGDVTTDHTVPTNNPNVSAETAANSGVSQVGTTSQVTGQIVKNVTSDAPVQTNTGASIISTQNGQVVLSDGSTVAPEVIGAVTNADKTITVTKADGTKATLPETGEATNILAVFGTGSLGLVGFLFKKKFA